MNGVVLAPPNFAAPVLEIFTRNMENAQRPSQLAIEHCSAAIWDMMGRRWAAPLLTWELGHAIGVVLRDAPGAVERLGNRPMPKLADAFAQVLSAAQAIEAIWPPPKADSKPPKRNGKANPAHKEWGTVFGFVVLALEQAAREEADLQSVTLNREVRPKRVSRSDDGAAAAISVEIIGLLKELGKWETEVPTNDALAKMVRRFQKAERAIKPWWSPRTRTTNR